ncbi:MAG: c-type cytochrome [Pseudomonadota bacterium]
MSAQNDAAFLRMFLVILGALIAFTIGILMVAHTVSAELRANHPDAARATAKVEARIAPVAQVKVAGQEPAAPPMVVKTGAEIVAQACNSCHISGILGAPKIGDQAAWEVRLAQGIDSVYLNAINGKGGMPARGGAADLTDEDVRAAVRDMLANSGLPQ